MYQNMSQIKKAAMIKLHNCLILLWSHLGSNQGPSDYESDALTG